MALRRIRDWGYLSVALLLLGTTSRVVVRTPQDDEAVQRITDASQPQPQQRAPQSFSVMSGTAEEPLYFLEDVKPFVLEALSLYDAAGQWEQTTPEATRRAWAARMEEILTSHVPLLSPVALSLGNGLMSLSNVSGALFWFSECSRVSTRVGHHVTAGIATMNRALAYTKSEPLVALGLLEEATDSFMRGERAHRSFWLGNTLCERADILIRIGRHSAAEQLLASWMPEIAEFSRVYLLRGNIAWFAGEGSVAASHWLAGVQRATARGDAIWSEKLLLVAYAASAVAGFVKGGNKHRPNSSNIASFSGPGSSGGSIFDGGVRNDSVFFTCALNATEPPRLAFSGAPQQNSSSGGGDDGVDLDVMLAPSRIVDAGVARAVHAVRALLADCSYGGHVLATTQCSYSSRSGSDPPPHRSLDVHLLSGAAPPPDTTRPTCGASTLHSRLDRATRALPWGVIAVTAAKRNVLWHDWVDIEEAVSLVEGLCVAGLATHAAAVRVYARHPSRNSSSPPPSVPEWLWLCARDDTVSYAPPYEHIGYGTGMSPFSSALLAGVTAAFTKTSWPLRDAEGTVKREHEKRITGTGRTARRIRAWMRHARPPSSSLANGVHTMCEDDANTSSTRTTRVASSFSRRVVNSSSGGCSSGNSVHAGAPMFNSSSGLAAVAAAARRRTPPRALHAALLSYDMRSHASAWLAESYARYFNPSRVTLSIWSYGPLDNGTVISPSKSSSRENVPGAAAAPAASEVEVRAPFAPWQRYHYNLRAATAERLRVGTSADGHVLNATFANDVLAALDDAAASSSPHSRCSPQCAEDNDADSTDSSPCSCGLHRTHSPHCVGDDFDCGDYKPYAAVVPLVAQQLLRSTMSERIAFGAAAFFQGTTSDVDADLCRGLRAASFDVVASSVGAAASAFDTSTPAASGGDYLSAAAPRSFLPRVHIVDEHMGHTFGARMNILRSCFGDDDNDDNSSAAPALHRASAVTPLHSPASADVDYHTAGPLPPQDQRSDSRSAHPAPAPPPIVVSFMYPGPTSLSHVDYVVSDTVVAPPDEYFSDLLSAIPTIARGLLRVFNGAGNSASSAVPHQAEGSSDVGINSSCRSSRNERLLGQSYSERLLLMPHAYTAHFYSCAAPLLFRKKSGEQVHGNSSGGHSHSPNVVSMHTLGICHSHSPNVVSMHTLGNCHSHSHTVAKPPNVASWASSVAPSGGARNVSPSARPAATAAAHGTRQYDSSSSNNNNVLIARQCRNVAPSTSAPSCSNTLSDNDSLSAPPSTAAPSFTFASLNSYAKLDPIMFSAWTNALRSGGAHSELLLLGSSPAASQRLRAEAAARGIHPSRIRFAASLPRDEHVARYATDVDLVLDPRTITGHTTTADALWAGVPTVTMEAGNSLLPGRVSSSFLSATGEGVDAALIAHSLLEYEDSASAYAGSTRTVWALHARLIRASLTSPMLNWPASVSALERGYRSAWEVRSLSHVAVAATPPNDGDDGVDDDRAAAPNELYSLLGAWYNDRDCGDAAGCQYSGAAGSQCSGAAGGAKTGSRACSTCLASHRLYNGPVANARPLQHDGYHVVIDPDLRALWVMHNRSWSSVRVEANQQCDQHRHSHADRSTPAYEPTSSAAARYAAFVARRRSFEQTVAEVLTRFGETEAAASCVARFSS